MRGGISAVKSMVKNWMHHDPIASEPVSTNELTSLSALIAHVAYATGQSEFGVERNLADRFSIPNVKCLPMKDYDEAIRHLVDQVPASQNNHR